MLGAPVSVLDTTTFDQLIAAAARAPSSHNTQPWRFQREEDRIGLYADRTRSLPVNDPDDRELTISCGAALFNLHVAAAAAGLRPIVELLTAGDEQDRLATLRLHQDPTGNVGEMGQLGEAIWLRRTHRGPFAPGRLTPGAIAAIDEAAAEHQVLLRWLEPATERASVAELVAAGDRAQFADPAWRRELASWMRPRRCGDGLVVPPVLGIVTRFVVAHVDVGRTTAGKDAALLRSAPQVAVLATREDQRVDWVTAGQALQHVLLVAATQGIAAGYANQPCQVPRLRSRLRDSVALEGTPQAVIRFGVATTAGRQTPRRGIAEMVAPSAREQHK